MSAPHRALRLAVWGCSALLFTSVPGKAGAQPPAAPQEKTEAQTSKQSGLSLHAARKIEFSTDEGTWVSLDVSSDGRSIVFDLVGHLYSLNIEGGNAVPITSGFSFESQPRFSPDIRNVVSGWRSGLEGRVRWKRTAPKINYGSCVLHAANMVARRETYLRSEGAAKHSIGAGRSVAAYRGCS